ncbi:MAG TPA: PIG-L family deacetylase, partial [Solirubrobacteraceae bacterium]|nr:PIG-L family deacetylase [Solirubrobacteraceae bacterium]
MTSVLVVCAHPDDEAVGCGGALRRHVLAGDRVSAVFLTSGEAGGHGLERAGETREREARVAADVLGIGELAFWREPDAGLRARAALIERLARVIADARASLVYAPHA